MTHVGSYEAKTHLARLMGRVQKGERITITPHGVPVAELNPAGGAPQMSVEEAVEALPRFRQDRKMKGSTLGKWIEAGRR